MVGMVYDKISGRLTLSGRNQGQVAFEVDFKAASKGGLLPSTWRALDKVSCNSSYDRWVRGLNTEQCRNIICPSKTILDTDK